MSYARYHSVAPFQFVAPPFLQQPFESANESRVSSWRSLALEFDDEIRMFWDNRLVGKRPMTELQRAAQNIIQQVPDMKGVFPFGQRLGIYLNDGTASFRRVILRPL